MKEFICIVCPRGCRLRVDSDLYEPTVSGNACPRGKDYAIAEYTNPTRTVTFNIRVEGGERPVVSARTARPVAVVKVLPMARLSKKISVKAPIKAGQTLVASLLGEKIIATSAVAKADTDL